MSDIEQSIKSKIEAVGTPLRDWDIQINYGIKTGYNDAFVITTDKRDEILTNCHDDDERFRTSEIIRPILRGRDIKRYNYDWADLWLIYIPWHFPLHEDDSIQGTSVKAEETFKTQYPTIYQHLLAYKENLSARNKAETGIRYEWYAMQRWGANYSDDFNKPKIVYAELARTGNAFTIDTKRMVVGNTGYIITFDSDVSKERLYCLTGFLNSKATLFYLDHSCSKFDENGWRWLRQFVENIPIPQQTNHQLFLEITKAIEQCNSDCLQRINTIVYEILGLTPDEIAYLEKKYVNY